MTNQFTNHLAKVHHSVNALLAIHTRSTEFLCVALADVYGLLREVRQNPDAFIEIARVDYNVKVTGAAADPLALLAIKVAFKGVPKEFDGRRSFNTWSLAIARMDSLEVPVEHAARYLQDTGIVTCAAAHRKALNREDAGRKLAELRRTESYVAALPKIGTTTKFFDGEQLATINTANDQETLRALAQQPGRVLILGYIDENFDLRLEGIVERDQGEIARFLARKARAPMAPQDQCQPASTELFAVNDNDIHISVEEAA
jgi:hypothetical protein